MKKSQTEPQKEAEKPIITQSEPPKPTEPPIKEESEQLQPAEKPIPPQSVEDLEVVEAEIVENEEVAPVQQPERPIITHAEEHFEKQSVESKEMTHLKDEIVKLLGEVIGQIYESKWNEALNNLEHVDYMIKS